AVLGDPSADRRPARRHGLHRIAHHRGAATGSVRPDHGGRAARKPSPRRRHDGRSIQLLPPVNSELAMVEMGMGRAARRTYELSEISIVPSRRPRSSQDVSTAWQLDAYRFEIPVVAHPTDALVSPEFAIELGRLGGLGGLNGEGLIGRHPDVHAKIAEVVEAAAKEPEPSAAIRLLQKLHAEPLDPELLAAAVAQIREA